MSFTDKDTRGAILTISPSWSDLPSKVKEKYKSCGAAFFAFYKVLIDNVSADCPAVLLDVNAAEAYGLEGYLFIKTIIKHAHDSGMYVFADTERTAYSENEVAKLAKVWLSDEETAFDCDAFSFATEGMQEGLIKKAAVEAERYGKGVFSHNSKDAKERFGIIMSNPCKLILDELADMSEDVITVAVPTAIENEEELKEVARRATFIAAPGSVITPGAFYKFKELLE